jgi:hypothetical protein
MSAKPPLDRTEFVFGHQVPPSTQSVTVSIRITPRSGTVSIYASPDDNHPMVQCKGPSQQVTIGYGTGRIFLEKTSGTTDYEIRVLSWNKE